VGNIQLRNLDERHVHEWFFGPKGLSATVTQPASFNYYRSRLQTFLRFCTVRGWLRNDPLIDLRRRPVPREVRLTLDAAEMLKLLDLAANPRDRCFIAVAINTGARASEIVGLRVGDVDLGKENLLLRISKTTEEDLMPITADLDPELRSWLITYAGDLGISLTRTMPLFPASTGPRWRYEAGPDGRKVRVTDSPSWAPERVLSNPANVGLTRLGGQVGCGDHAAWAAGAWRMAS